MNSQKDDTANNSKVWRSFSINISFVILLFILSIFAGLFINQKHLIESELKARGRSYFKNIVITRHWNASYGGVYVEKKPGMISNPYLENPDIETVEGITYTMKNPALMTREISELAEKDGEYQFHITSLRPINPDNRADEFEKQALESFESGAKELFIKEKQGPNSYFRYMAPLYVEESCLQCHAKQGYKLDEIRGGISVRFNIDAVEKSLSKNKYIILSLFLATSILLLGIIYFFIIDLNRKFSKALRKINVMANTDDLTGIYNRRYFLEKLDEEIIRSIRYNHFVSCLLLDVDFFKKVNDTYGHLAGDIVLKKLAETLRDSCRQTDIVARFGGEEFVLLLSETDAEGALSLAEKIRSVIERKEFVVDKAISLRVTVCIGVTVFSSTMLGEIGGVDQLINLADIALYKAKEKGRNRVEFIDPMVAKQAD